MVREAAREPATTHEEQIKELERTLESLREDSEVAHVLLGLSGALAEIRTVEETLEKAVRITRELFGADRCFAASWDGHEQQFELLAHYRFEAEHAAALAELAKASPGGLPLLKECLDRRSPILLDDVTNESRFTEEFIETRKFGGYIVIPLLHWGQIYGGLGIEFNEPRVFTAKDVALARGIARQVGVALTNARRFGLLQSLRGIGLRVGSKLRLAMVAREVGRGAAQLLNGDDGCLYYFQASENKLRAAGRVPYESDIGEALHALDLADETWAELALGRTVTLHDFRSRVGVRTAPISVVAVPIPGSESPLLGAVLVFFERSFTLGPDEAEAVNVLAAQSSAAIENAQRYERQRSVARSLQSALLQTEMPKFIDYDVAAVYEPASAESDIGGDYFDVFDLTSQRVALVVGDVSGKGAEAAAQTAMAKYMLRAFAMRNPGPSSVLFHLNNALLQGLAEDRFTTLALAVLDPRGRSMQLALGGHPPPLLYRAETGEVDVLEVSGSIVGAFSNQRFDQAEFAIEQGDIFLAYTDGLIETRSESGELFGRERVAESLVRHADSSAHDLTRQVYEEARAFGTVTDDTIVFALVARPPENK